MSMGGGGGGEQTIGYWYKLGVQLAVCQSPIDHVSQLVFGEHTAWTGQQSTSGDIVINRLDLFGGEEREGGVAGRIGVHIGTANEPIDPYVRYARGETSAQRGICTMVFGGVSQTVQSDVSAIDYSKSIISTYMAGLLDQTGSEQFSHKVRDVNYQFSKQEGWNYVNRIVDPNEKEFDTIAADLGGYRQACIYYAYAKYVLGNAPKPRNSHMVNELDFWEVKVPKVENIRTVTATNPFIWCAMNPYFKSVWVRVQSIFNNWTLGNGNTTAWYPDKAAIAGTPHAIDSQTTIAVNDMNPAHIIYNVLTNRVWGMGYNPEDIDDTSFKRAADILFNESFGLSLAWRREEVIEEFLNIILKTIDGILRVNAVTGKFQLLLIRNDYDINTLSVLNEDNIISLQKYERSSWGDTPNEIVLTYRDRNEDAAVVTVQNIAAIETQQGVISTTVEYVGIHEHALAARVAQRELNMASTPLAKISITTNRLAFLLQVGDVFKFQWSELGIESMAMRVISINKGDYEKGAITIDAIEDVFGLPKTAYITNDTNLWQEEKIEPVEIHHARVWEMPYYDVVNYLGENHPMLAQSDNYTATRAFIDMPTGVPTISADVWAASTDNTNSYKQVLYSVNYVANTTLLFGVDKTTTTFPINAIENLPAQLSKSAYAVIDDEVLRIESIDQNTGKLRVGRGCLDTIPANHSVGAKIWIVEPVQNVDTTTRVLGETVYYRPLCKTTRSTRSIAAQGSFHTTLVGRSNRPYPPANVTIDGVAYKPSILSNEPITLFWATRNRKMATLVDWTAGSVQSETGVTYDIKLSDPDTGTVFYDDTDIEGTNKTYVPIKRPIEIDSSKLAIYAMVYHYNFQTHTNGAFTPVRGLSTDNAEYWQNGALNANPTVDAGVTTDSNAVHLLSNNSCITLPYHASFNNVDLTVFMRVYLPDVQNVTPLFYIENMNGSNNGADIRCGIYVQSGQLQAYVGKSSSPFRVSAPINVGWNDILVCFDSYYGKVVAWINGVETTAILGGWSSAHETFSWTATPTTRAKIGNYDTQYANGMIVDEFILFNKALAQSELNAILQNTMVTRWSKRLTIDINSRRGNVKSYQTFSHTMTTK